MSDLPPNILAELARRRLNLQSQSDLNRQRLEETYGLNKEDIGRYQKEGVGNINNQYAGRGLFNSGLRVDEQGRLTRDVTDRYSDLERTRGRGLEDIQRGLTTGLGDIDAYQQEQSRVYAAQRLQEQLQQQQMQMQQDQLAQLAAGGGGGGGSYYGDTGPSIEDQLAALLEQQQQPPMQVRSQVDPGVGLAPAPRRVSRGGARMA